MQRNDPERDEEAWRSIVDNYGDRAEIEDEPAAPPPPAAPYVVAAPEPVECDDEVDPVDRFVPPDPPLPPRPTRDRLAAWIGVIGSPLLLLVLVLAGIDIPRLLGYPLVIGFIGGFGYLVLHLPRSPEDPWDDGARL